METVERGSPAETSVPRAAGDAPDALHALIARVPGLDALAIVTRDGEVLASAGADEETIRAFASFLIGLQDLGDRVAAESGRGESRMTLVACERGHLAVHLTAEDHLLLALCGEDAPMGVVIHDIGRLARGEAPPIRPGRTQ